MAVLLAQPHCISPMPWPVSLCAFQSCMQLQQSCANLLLTGAITAALGLWDWLTSIFEHRLCCCCCCICKEDQRQSEQQPALQGLIPHFT
jgi:hypothetical protein